MHDHNRQDFPFFPFLFTDELQKIKPTTSEISALPNNSDLNSSTDDVDNEVDVSSVAPSAIIMTPNESSNTTPIGTPDLKPTVTPPGSPTVPQTAYPNVMSVETDFQLDSDYDDEDSDNDPSSLLQPTSTAPWTPSMEAQIFISSIPSGAPATFGGISDEDPYDPTPELTTVEKNPFFQDKDPIDSGNNLTFFGHRKTF